MKLEDLIAKPVDRVVFKPGYADTYPNVKLGGQSVPATWIDGIYAKAGTLIQPGTQVLVAQLIFADAPPVLVVVGTFTGLQPREGTVTVVPGGSATITVQAAGVNYTATFLNSYTPTVNDTVRLLWQGQDVTVVGKVGATPATVSTDTFTPAPAPAQSSGHFDFIASDSATYVNGLGWNNWSGGNTVVYDGAWGGYTTIGAWFYNGATTQLAGHTTQRLQFYLPARLTAGNYNDAQNLTFYLHTSNTRPGSDVTRGASTPFINPATGAPGVPAYWGGGYVDLPPSWGATLAAGGGISIAGDLYMGFNGIAQDPASGQIHADWSP